MALVYDLKPTGGDIHDVAPYWFAAFVRFEYRDTFSRARMNSTPQNSSAVEVSEGVKEQDLLIADNDVVAWSVTTSKSSHTSALSCTLSAGNIDYTSALASGDWVGFWAFDNKQDYIRVREEVRKANPANGFMDGLKFLGRVDAIRRREARAPTGQKQIQYTLTGTGFSEFDATVYYNSFYKAKYGQDALLWMLDFGDGEDNLILGSTYAKGLIGSQEAIPKLLRICMGLSQDSSGNVTAQGPSDESAWLSKEWQTKPQNAALHGTLNKGYMVPPTVGKWFGDKKEQSQTNFKGLLSYPDILRSYIGVQSYDGGATINRDRSFPDDLKSFTSQIRNFNKNTYFTDKDLTGVYRVLTMHFDNRSVWAILQTYVNDPIDEMYSCLRVDPNGKVHPSLVVRQTPLSSNWYAQNGKYGNQVTPFLSLPRWRPHGDIVTELDVGRSNVLRHNYIQLLGQDMSGTNTQDNETLGFVRNLPVIDPTDANRCGLRMYEKQLSANVNEALASNSDSQGSMWTQIMADILFGSHLKYSGTMVCKGIQEPICEGDNLEYDNVVYQIEGISHSGSINVFGQRDFVTTLQISNGVSAFNLEGTEVMYPDLRERFQQSPSSRFSSSDTTFAQGRKEQFKASTVEREGPDVSSEEDKQ